MIEFDDDDIQKKFNECHFRQEYGEVDVCRGMCTPCRKVIEGGQCAMLRDYFGKRKETSNDYDKKRSL